MRGAGLLANDQCFGIAWTGNMTTNTLLRLAPNLPDGISEIYLHPAAQPDPLLTTLMPDYHQQDELAALLDPSVRYRTQQRRHTNNIWRDKKPTQS